MLKPLFKHPFLRSKWLATGFLVLLGIFVPLFIFGASPFIDDFDSYTPNTQLSGQGGWTCSYNNIWITDAGGQTGANALAQWTGYIGSCKKQGDELIAGDISFWVKLGDCADIGGPNNAGGLFTATETQPLSFAFFWDSDLSQCKVMFYGRTEGEGGPFEYSKSQNYFSNWTRFQFQWKKEGEISYGRHQLGEETTTDWYSLIAGVDNGVSKFWLTMVNKNLGTYLFDSIGPADLEPPPPLELRVWGSVPESGTEITNLETEFTFNWEGLDPEIYDGLLVSFRESTTGIHTKAFEFEDLESEGSKTLPFSDFEIDKNSHYYFHALGYGVQIEIIEGMYLTGHYIDFFTEDVVSPVYFIITNVEGLSPVFAMADWETWYRENTPYEEPTALFTAIADVLAGPFSKLGEFGNRVIAYLDLKEASGRGFDLGKIFPMTNQYIKNIEFLFGGFPLVRIFLIILMLLIGIFIVKLIFKFIPFFG